MLYKIAKRFILPFIFGWSKLFSRYGLGSFIKKVVNNHAEFNNKEILVIGSGGSLAQFLTPLGKNNNIISIDFDPDRHPDIVMDAQDMSFEIETFDLVLMFEVLEHIPNPFLAISEIHRVLKPGGHLYLSTPFILGIHDAPHDYFRYTRFGLLKLTECFEKVEVNERNGYLASSIVILIRLIMSKYYTDKIIGMFILILATIFSPIIWVMSKTVRDRSSTTGYVLEAEKSK